MNNGAYIYEGFSSDSDNDDTDLPQNFKLRSRKGTTRRRRRKQSGAVVNIDDISIHQLARDGAIEELRKISLRNNLSTVINQVNSENQAAIHLAARYNKSEVIGFFIQEGADIDLPGELGNTALHIAIKYNSIETAKLLIQFGANCKAQNVYGRTALHFAARRGSKEICELLLNPNDVNGKDNRKATPLHMAVTNGNIEVVKLLLQHNSKIGNPDSEGLYPIHIAALEGHAELIPLLIDFDFVGVNIKTNESQTPLHLAAEAGHLNAVKTLVSLQANLNCYSKTQMTPLHRAVSHHHVAVIKYMIENGAEIDAKDEMKMTPLHSASSLGIIDSIEYLLEQGAKLDARDEDNFTPLLASVWNGQSSAVEILLRKGADLTHTDSSSKTVLHIAVQRNFLDTLKLLLDNGADKLIDQTDQDFRTPLHYAAKAGHFKTISALLNSNCRLDLRDMNEQTAIHLAAKSGRSNAVAMLANASLCVINLTDDDGRTAMHIGAMNGFLNVCQKLISMGAEVAVKDDILWTPLDYAAAKGYSKVMQLLLTNNSPMDTTNVNHETALHHATSNGHVDCVIMLLDYGASISLTDKNGMNCFDLAVKNYKIDVCMALIKHDRWNDIMRKFDKNGISPMEKLIKIAPEVADAALHQCVVYSELPKEHKDYSITYNFEYLDILRTRPNHAIEFFGPSKMAEYNRGDLLAHPATLALINHYWDRIGKKFYFFTLTVYLLFVCLMTTLIVKSRDAEEHGICIKGKVDEVLPVLCLILVIIHSVKEVFQLVTTGVNYFFILENYIEVAQSVSNILFLIPFFYDKHFCDFSQDFKRQSAAVCIILAWSNLLLYIKRVPSIGIIVLMFVQVSRTAFKVLAIFSIVLIGFALSFHILLDEMPQFKTTARSMSRVMIMMTGEFDYDAIFTESFGTKFLPNKEISIILFVLFAILLPIAMLNLLIGLAAGEIEEVRAKASLVMLKQQVELITSLTRRFPKPYRRSLLKTEIISTPNRRNIWSRILDFMMPFDFNMGHDTEETTGNPLNDRSYLNLERNVEQQTKQMVKLNKEIKDIRHMVSYQNDLHTFTDDNENFDADIALDQIKEGGYEDTHF